MRGVKKQLRNEIRAKVTTKKENTQSQFSALNKSNETALYLQQILCVHFQLPQLHRIDPSLFLDLQQKFMKIQRHGRKKRTMNTPR